MINTNLCNQILSVGCEYSRPKGGVAQVMNTYSNYVYSVFRCVVNSGGNNALIKLLRAIISFLQTLVLLIFDRRVKILHIHTASYNSFKRSSYWIRLGKIFNKKIVLHIHGGGFRDYYKTNPKWVQSVLDKSDCILVLSNIWKNYFEGELGCKNVEIVENIVPLPVLNNKVKGDNRFHLLFLGLITKEKGIFDLLEMIAEHRDVLEHKILLHIGGLGKVDELTALIQSLHIDCCVIYEGFVSGERKQYLLNQSDAFILPSYVEGMPISILEAMSYGIPIMCTPVGGIPEVVKNGKNGYLFEPGDKVKMFEVLQTLLYNPKINNEIGVHCKKTVSNHLPNNVCGKLEIIYGNLLNE